MRGKAKPESVASPFRLGDTLPGIYREPDGPLLPAPEPPRYRDGHPVRPVVLGLCSALDDVLAPVFAVLDNFSAYLDPRTAPEDMLDWLAAWIGLSIANRVPESTKSKDPAATRKNVIRHKRKLIFKVADVLSHPGTPKAIKAEVDAAFGVDSEVLEVRDPRGEGSPPKLYVRIATNQPKTIDEGRLRRLVAEIKPAHLPHDVKVVGLDQPTQPIKKPTPPALAGVDGERIPPS